MSQVGPDLHCATDRAAGNVGNDIGHRRAHLARIFDGCGQDLSNGIHRRLDNVSRAFDCGHDLVFHCLNHSRLCCLHVLFPFVLLLSFVSSLGWLALFTFAPANRHALV